MASVRGILNIQSLNELTYEKSRNLTHKRTQAPTKAHLPITSAHEGAPAYYGTDRTVHTH